MNAFDELQAQIHPAIDASDQACEEYHACLSTHRDDGGQILKARQRRFQALDRLAQTMRYVTEQVDQEEAIDSFYGEHKRLWEHWSEAELALYDVREQYARANDTYECRCLKYAGKPNAYKKAKLAAVEERVLRYKQDVKLAEYRLQDLYFISLSMQI